MLNENIKISCFMPVYNEANIIVQNIREVHSYLSKHYDNFEIFVIDDASCDGTSDKLKNISSTYPNLVYLRYANGPSKRENLAQSFLKATGDLIFFIDGDLEAKPNNLPVFIKTLQNDEADIVIGNRYSKKSITYRRLTRLLISKIYNLNIRIFFKSTFIDHQCGLKAFKKNVLIKLINDMGYDATYKRGWFWDAELLIRASYNKFIIKEVPVVWNDRKKLRSFSFKENIKIIPFIFNLKKQLEKNKNV